MSGGRRVLVTGASSGIGRATAVRLAEAGWEVWGTSRDPARLPVGVGMHGARLDLGLEGDLPTILEELWMEAGGFTAVVNNAGAGIFGPLAEVSAAGERKLFQVLFHGPMAVTRYALRKMEEAGGGRVVQVTTLGAELPIPFMGTYSAAKAAFSTATRVLRMEKGRGPVRLIEVRPGDIQTDFNRSVERSAGSETPQGERVWQKMEALMGSAPAADVVGRRIVGLLAEADPPNLVRVGGFFQTVIGPLGRRLLPERVVEKLIADYYELG